MRRAPALLLAVSLLRGSSYLPTERALHGCGPLMITLAQMLIATAALAIARRGRGELPRVRDAVAVGTMQFGLPHIAGTRRR